MFTAWILLMLNSLFFTLRLSGGGSGSFPRPLKAEEERMYLERMAQGDLEARNILIEHNLRRVAVQSCCQARFEWMAITGIWISSMRPASCCLVDSLDGRMSPDRTNVIEARKNLLVKNFRALCVVNVVQWIL